MAFELILQDIELADNTINDNTFDVWFDYQAQVFLAKELCTSGRTFKYIPSGDLEEIAMNNRQEILKYRLGRVTPDDKVTIGDIFMHAKFIEKIS
jgi:hypothetical protein